MDKGKEKTEESEERFTEFYQIAVRDNFSEDLTNETSFDELTSSFKIVKVLGVWGRDIVAIANVTPHGEQLWQTANGYDMTSNKSASAPMEPVKVCLRMRFVSNLNMMDSTSNFVIPKYLTNICCRGFSTWVAAAPYVKTFTAYTVQAYISEIVKLFDMGEVRFEVTHWFSANNLAFPGLLSGKRYDDIDPLMASVSVATNLHSLMIQIDEAASEWHLGNLLRGSSKIPTMLSSSPVIRQMAHSRLLLHCLCNLHLLHNIANATHFSPRAKHWHFRTLHDAVIRYDVATNVTVWIPSIETMNQVPILGHFERTAVHTHLQQGITTATSDARSEFLNPPRHWSKRRDNFENKPNPLFDLRMLGLSFLRPLSLNDIKDADYRLLKMISLMIFPDQAFDALLPLNTHDLPAVAAWFVSTTLRTLMTEKTISAAVSMSTADHLKFRQALKAMFEYTAEIQSTREPRQSPSTWLLEEFLKFFPEYMRHPSNLAELRVVDMGIRLGHVSGGSLPAISV